MVTDASLWRNLVSIIPPRRLTELNYPGETEQHDVLKYSIIMTFPDRHIFHRRLGMYPIAARLTTIVATAPFPDRQTKIIIIQEIVLIGNQNQLTRVTEYDINVSVQLTSVYNIIHRLPKNY